MTPTPTGLARRLSGRWFADWGGQPCFLDGELFARLADTVYVLTAVAGELDIETEGGERIGRGLEVQPDGTVEARVRSDVGRVCRFTGVVEEFLFDYVFVFRTNGSGSATAAWSYGINTNCAVCTVNDAAVLTRVSGP